MAETHVENQRFRNLRQFLEDERGTTLNRIRDYRASQEQEAFSSPADELDVARSLSEVETHASLIERAEDRLRTIDFALSRLEQGRYGICANCGEEILLSRLKALPFAVYCVDCQENRDHKISRFGEGSVDQPFARSWEVPEEMQENAESDHLHAVEDDLPIHSEDPFGPEEGELKDPPKARRRRTAKK
ncbi:MAG: TraR/DksA family transcriptional regulator [Candidatus Binataceae bacterium]|nr:TraR/DksA family transcriptional regulator [Candidatus Binataceae bacterium]